MKYLFAALLLVLGIGGAQAQGFPSLAYGTPAGCYFSATAQTIAPGSFGYLACSATGAISTSSTAAPYNGAAGVTAVTVGVASALALAARTAPQHLLSLKNESATASIACVLGPTAALNTAGNFTLAPGQLLTWSENSVPLEAVNCIASAAATPLTVSSN